MAVRNNKGTDDDEDEGRIFIDAVTVAPFRITSSYAIIIVIHQNNVVIIIMVNVSTDNN
jgi:hypothetical protein